MDKLCQLYDGLRVTGYLSVKGHAIGCPYLGKTGLSAGNTRFHFLQHLFKKTRDEKYNQMSVVITKTAEDAILLADLDNRLAQAVRGSPQHVEMKSLWLKRLTEAFANANKKTQGQGTSRGPRKVGTQILSNVLGLKLQTRLKSFVNKVSNILDVELQKELMNVAVDHFGFVVFGKKSTEWMTYVRVFPKDTTQGMMTLLDTVQDDNEQKARRAAYFLVKQKKLKVSSAKDWEWLIQQYLLYSKSPSKSPSTSADEFVQGLLAQKLMNPNAAVRASQTTRSSGTHTRSSRAMEELAAAAEAEKKAVDEDDAQLDHWLEVRATPNPNGRATTNNCKFCSGQKTPWHCAPCYERTKEFVYVCSPQTGRPCFSRHCQGGCMKPRKVPKKK